ncbi:chemoreceptor glutamine deamidase CheD [Marinobacter sp. CHS3-4]|uniref:chemoreceptor glutamine deamidase CheD n=1 Tax=Marinobacter sp. CHS3-4 TaxID=3045174 RepID=UPI0024B486B2|nr:chemoreceptor glutamine deamidase CheD [Marinobacter sp. CHS3-4]MDI9245621.1 chemoreceptor glutamine deamidase CheD [Marinobacter sp. CHS3-4]
MTDLRAADQHPERAGNLYYDGHFKRSAVKLLPGEYYATRDNRLLCTVLGSCVAACLRDRQAKIAGMNHFLLASTADTEASARYGIHAMELLINQMLKLGASRQRLEAKLFGGANMMHSQSRNNIGAQNARFAQKFMSDEGIPVVSHDLFGDYARKIWFLPDTGKVMMRRLTKTRNDTVLRREVDLGRKLSAESPQAGDVELFEQD